MSKTDTSTNRIIIELRWNKRVARWIAAACLLAVAALSATVVLALGGAHIPATAELITAPTIVAFQGQLPSGMPNGAGLFKFAIVNAAGNTSYWSNDGTSVGGSEPAASVSLTVTNGMFNVLLGDTTLSGMTLPLSASAFTAADRNMRVWASFNGSAFKPLPRDQRIASVPFALNAETLDGMDSTSFAPAVHTHSGVDIISGTVAEARIDLLIARDSEIPLLAGAAGFITQTLADARYARISPNPQQIAILKWYPAYANLSNIAITDQLTPVAVAFDGRLIWTANFNSNSISILQLNPPAFAGTWLGFANPHGLAYDGRYLWVANWTGNNVMRVDSGYIVQTVTVGTNPHSVAFDGTNIWVTNYGSSSVSVIKADDGSIVRTVSVAALPQGIAFDGTNMWVVSGDSVSAIRASDGVVVMTSSVGTSPNGIAFDGTNMWVTNLNSNNVSVIRASDGYKVMTPTIDSPSGIAFDGANMWVSNMSSGTVTVVRASDGAIIKVVPVGLSPRGIAFDGVNMWIVNQDSNTVSKR